MAKSPCSCPHPAEDHNGTMGCCMAMVIDDEGFGDTCGCMGGPLQRRIDDVNVLLQARARLQYDEDLADLDAYVPGLTTTMAALLDHFADARQEGIVSPHALALARVLNKAGDPR